MSARLARMLGGLLLFAFACSSCAFSSGDPAAGRYVQLVPATQRSRGASPPLVKTYELRKDGTWQSKDTIGVNRAEPLDGMAIVSWGRFTRDEYGIRFSLDSVQSSMGGVPDQMERIDSSARENRFRATSWGAMVRVDTLIFPSDSHGIGAEFTYYVRVSR